MVRDAQAVNVREEVHSHRSVSSAHSHTSSARMRKLAQVAEHALGDGDTKMFGCMWSRAAKTFFISLTLCTTITAAQVAGALIANSMALLADCASMAIDSLTYAFNLAAECKTEEDERKLRRNQLVASGVSFMALIAISIVFIFQGISSIVDASWDDSAPADGTPAEGSDDGDVNPYIVFAFAVAGILVDVLSLVPYMLYGCPCIKRDEESSIDKSAETSNLCSALLHVSSDLMRSTTTFVESILIWAYGINGDEVDAYATVIVLATIIFGAVKPVYDWSQDVRSYYNDYYVSMDTEQRALL